MGFHIFTTSSCRNSTTKNAPNSLLAMGKYKIPTVPEFLTKKRKYSKKRVPEWIYLEKEMIDSIAKKPYNEKVHDWLVYLKELRHHSFIEGKRKEKRLLKEVGPAWYFELSSNQRKVLAHLKSDMHQDLLEDIPRRIRMSLSDLGLTLKIPKKILMKTMGESFEDPGVFIWNLYKAVYQRSPSDLRDRYDMNAALLMSSLVFIDLDECLEKLGKLTHYPKKPEVIKEKKQKQYFEPNIPYGQYLQKLYVPLYTPYRKKKIQKPVPLGNKFRLRSEASYEKLIKDTTFLQKRKERNKHETEKERVCNYKFWEPPSTLRNTDPKMIAYVNKLKMLKKKARAKYKAPYNNVQYLVGGVSFSGGRAHYMLTNVALLPTGYISINEGVRIVNDTAVSQLSGFWKYPIIEIEKCDTTCDCLTKWEPTVMKYLTGSKCRCGHLYDLFNEGKLNEKYFYPPTKHEKFWFDQAKIYQMDPTEDFIKDTFKEALKSDDSLPETEEAMLSASGLKESELLAAFLADLSKTPLLIPHLPHANYLNNLQEWVRKRVKGQVTPREHKRMLLKSQRRWLDLKHVDHRARAYFIPFTQKQLKHIKWSHRYMVQRLFEVLLENFISRNRLKQIQQTRMWWPTTKYDTYPSQAFLDIFFTYLPGRTKDTHFINPYSADLTPKYGAKTCPLNL